MIISLNELNKRETGKIDLNFSQKIDNISYCDNTYTLASPINLVGRISKNAKDELITNEGYPVLGENGTIRIAQGAKMVVSNDGNITVDGQVVGKMQVVEFANEKQLTKEGGSLYNAAAGQRPTAATGGVRQGFLEMSNVNVVGEMVNLISNYRAYEINGKVVQSHDQLIGKAVNEVGRL